MTSYETLFIVRPDIEEDDLNKVVRRVEDIVKSNEGTIVESQVWGKKRLAYEVKRYNEGIYVKLNFDAPPTIVQKLRDHFRLNEDVIREIIVREERRQMEPGPVGEESTPAFEDIAEESTQTDPAPVDDEPVKGVRETEQVVGQEEVAEERHTEQEDSEG